MVEVSIQGSSNIHFGPSFEFVNMTSAFFTTETIWAEVNVGQKCKKWWWLTKLMLKKAFIRDWKLTSANSKFTWKTPWTLEIDSLDHLKIFDPRDYFLIRAIFGPKTACELERLFKIVKKSQKHDSNTSYNKLEAWNSTSAFPGGQMYTFKRLQIVFYGQGASLLVF